MQTKTQFQTIDEYIGTFPKNVRELLQKMRRTIARAAPKASEKISYQIPTFQFHGNLVHFAGYKNHIGFYPGTAAVKAFQKELSGYKGAVGTVQFPIGEPLPLSLISKIVKFRVKANLAKAKK